MPTGPVVGGNTPPEILFWEAELGTIGGGAVQSTDWGGYSGSGFVDFVGASAETVSWTLDVVQTGQYSVGFRYALATTPKTIGGRPLEILVNGVSAGTLPFLPTGGFSEWQTQLTALVLPAGTVTLTVATTGASGANLDRLEIQSVPVVKLNTAPTIAGVLAPAQIVAGGAEAAIGAVTLADPDIADSLSLVCTLAGGGALPNFLHFDAASRTVTADAGATAGSYDLLLRATDGQALSADAVALRVVVQTPNLIPPDLDGDGIRNRRDADDDNDGLSDLVDPFLADASNGRGARIDIGTSLVLDFANVPAGVPAGWGLGLTGLMSNGQLSPEARGFATAALSFAGGALHIENAATGTPGPDTLLYGADFGVDVRAPVLRVAARFDNPYDTHTAVASEAFGLFIGTGDQDNYIRLILQAAGADSVSLRIEGESRGTAVAGYLGTFSANQLALSRADAGDTITLGFEIDTVSGLLRASWTVETATGAITGESGDIALTGALLDAVQGDLLIAGRPSGLAIGITANSGAGTPLDLDVLDISVTGEAANANVVLTGLDSPFLPDRVVFNWIDDPSQNIYPDREYKERGVVHISNTGGSGLSISQLVLDGPFKFLDASDLGARVLAPGESLDVEVGFDRDAFTPPSRGTGGQFAGDLRVISNDPDAPVATIDLAGWWQTVPEAGREPGLNDIFQIFGFGNRVDMAKLASGRYEQAAPEEVLAPYWKIAPGYSQVTVEQLAGFKDVGIAAFSIQAPGNFLDTRGVLTQDDLYNQTFFPTLTDGTTEAKTFDAARIPDAWVGDDWFGFRIAGNSTDPTLNRPPAKNGDIKGHFVRFFEATEADGTPIRDTYLIAVDYNGSNFDFNDTVYIVQGITPVPELLLV